MLYLASPQKLVIRRLRRSPSPRKQCALSYRKTKATMTSIVDLTDEYNGGVCLPTAATSPGAWWNLSYSTPKNIAPTLAQECSGLCHLSTHSIYDKKGASARRSRVAGKIRKLCKCTACDHLSAVNTHCFRRKYKCTSGVENCCREIAES